MILKDSKGQLPHDLDLCIDYINFLDFVAISAYQTHLVGSLTWYAASEIKCSWFHYAHDLFCRPLGPSTVVTPPTAP